MLCAVQRDQRVIGVPELIDVQPRLVCALCPWRRLVHCVVHQLNLKTCLNAHCPGTCSAHVSARLNYTCIDCMCLRLCLCLPLITFSLSTFLNLHLISFRLISTDLDARGTTATDVPVVPSLMQRYKGTVVTDAEVLPSLVCIPLYLKFRYSLCHQIRSSETDLLRRFAHDSSPEIAVTSAPAIGRTKGTNQR